MNSKGRRKSVQPLPSYTRRIWLPGKQCWAYYFAPPTWAVKPGDADTRGACPVGPEALGTDYAAAVDRAERVLLPQFHSWRTFGLADLEPERARSGTLDWLFGEYRRSEKFSKDVSAGMRSLHEAGFALVGNYLLKDGRRLGAVELKAIDSRVVDPLYENLLRVPLRGSDGAPQRDEAGAPLYEQARDEAGEPRVTADGRPIHRERRTTVNHAMKSCRRAWNVVFRLHTTIVPAVNPFAKMGLKSSGGVVPEATYPELQTAVRQADQMGMGSLAAALMVTWEWLQRKEHIFKAFKLEHYRPKDHPDEVLVVHPKSGDQVWVPLYDRSKGQPIALFPELMARMDALKQNRIGNGLFFVRDWIDARAGVPIPWVTARGHLSIVSHTMQDLVAAAGLREELTFTSFRHGGFTELGDAELSDAQVRALSRQKSSKIVRGYIKRTQRQIIEGTHKRRALRPARSATAGAAEEAQLSFDLPDDGGGRKGRGR